MVSVSSHPSWGTDRTILLCLNRALILSELNYGYYTYSSAWFSILRTLDIQGLSSPLAHITQLLSPVSVEVVKPPLEIYRMDHHVLSNYSMLSSFHGNPAHHLVVNPVLRDLYERSEGSSRPLSIISAVLIPWMQTFQQPAVYILTVSSRVSSHIWHAFLLVDQSQLNLLDAHLLTGKPTTIS